MLIFAYFIILNVYIFDTFSSAYEIIEWVCIGFMICSVSILALVNTSRSIYQLIQKCNRCLRSVKVYNQVEINNQELDQSSTVNTTQQFNISLESSNFGFPKFYNSLSLKDKRFTQQYNL